MFGHLKSGISRRVALAGGIALAALFAQGAQARSVEDTKA